MTKQEFLKNLNKELRGLSKKEKADCIVFYSEMIDDKIEEGLSEEKAVAEIGDVKTLAKERSSINSDSSDEKKLSAWDKTLLILASPIWAPLLVVALALYFTFWIVAWSLILTLWAVELPFLIMSVISKGLFPACEKITRATADFTAQGMKYLKKAFARKGEGRK